MRFEFAFDPLYRAVALPLGITPRTAHVEVGGDRMVAHFGLWTVDTPVANVSGTEVSESYSIHKTIGWAHLSVADRGLTFATNRRRGLCIRFHDPVPGLLPTGRLRHPGLTVTVADVDGLAAALDAATG